jgi:hypothetical protein
MYGYESSATLSTDRLQYKLQIRPLVREGSPGKEQSNCPVKRRKKKSLVMGQKKVADTKTDRPTDSRLQHQLNLD